MKARFYNLHAQLVLAGLAVVGGAAIGCSADIHDNVINIPNATVNATTDVDVNNVMPEQTIPIAMTVENVYLILPEMTPPADKVATAGHIRIYLDDVAMPPLMVTADVNVTVTIPAQTPPGKHKVICRVHKHDGTATSTKREIEIMVKASVTVGADGGVSVDAVVTTDTTTTTADATTPD